jgi:hypothetical protein
MRKGRGAPNPGKWQHEQIVYYPVRVHRHGLKVYRVGIVPLEEQVGTENDPEFPVFERIIFGYVPYHELRCLYR